MKGGLKQNHSGIQGTKFLESRTPDILKVGRLSFLSKHSKFHADLKKSIITAENVFGFKDKSIGTCWVNFFLLLQEYM